jgi:hypothetical protein
VWGAPYHSDMRELILFVCVRRRPVSSKIVGRNRRAG